jgi:hypothetical protein
MMLWTSFLTRTGWSRIIIIHSDRRSENEARKEEDGGWLDYKEKKMNRKSPNNENQKRREMRGLF